jgi:hypothetical protein
MACSIHPGIAGMCYPDKGNHVMEKESRKIKKLQQFHKNSRRPRRSLRFFATFSGNRIGLPQDKYTLNMGAQSY